MAHKCPGGSTQVPRRLHSYRVILNANTVNSQSQDILVAFGRVTVQQNAKTITERTRECCIAFPEVILVIYPSTSKHDYMRRAKQNLFGLDGISFLLKTGAFGRVTVLVRLNLSAESVIHLAVLSMTFETSKHARTETLRFFFCVLTRIREQVKVAWRTFFGLLKTFPSLGSG